MKSNPVLVVLACISSRWEEHAKGLRLGAGERRTLRGREEHWGGMLLLLAGWSGLLHGHDLYGSMVLDLLPAGQHASWQRFGRGMVPCLPPVGWGDRAPARGRPDEREEHGSDSWSRRWEDGSVGRSLWEVGHPRHTLGIFWTRPAWLSCEARFEPLSSARPRGLFRVRWALPKWENQSTKHQNSQKFWLRWKFMGRTGLQNTAKFEQGIRKSI
jgi:hypothetical protein